MSERAMKDVTIEYERMRAELMLIRVQLGLNPIHDLRYMIDKLYTQGREAFEKARGDPCEFAHAWCPPR